MVECNITDPRTAQQRNLLQKNPTLKRDPSSDKALKAFNISNITNTVKDNVAGFYFPQVKYKQGSWEKSYLPKFYTEKSVQLGHCPQVRNS